MIRIVSDSTCDLSPELIKRYSIEIVPLCIELGDREYLDGVNITPDEIYVWSDANKTTPRTAAVSYDTVEKLLRRYVESGDEVICFSISDTMSTTGNVFRMAAAELKADQKIHVFNSENLSTGIGLQVIEAALMASQGCGADEIIRHLESIRPRVRASFVVDTLTYLHRGGRCSSVAALLGSTLNLHPRIAVENGRMLATKKYRGKMPVVFTKYVHDMEPDLLTAKPDRVFITHSGCSDEIVSQIKTYLEGLHHFDEILITRAGCTVSSHCGPGTLGVLFIAGE